MEMQELTVDVYGRGITAHSQYENWGAGSVRANERVTMITNARRPAK
jgi:hypothetical protein